MKKEKLKWFRPVLYIVLATIFILLASSNRYGDTRSEALDNWLEEHKGMAEDAYWDLKFDDFYIKLDNEWYKLNFEKDFFGDWDVKEEKIGGTPEEIAETLSTWYEQGEITLEGIEDFLDFLAEDGMDTSLIRTRLIEKGVPLG